MTVSPLHAVHLRGDYLSLTDNLRSWANMHTGTAGIMFQCGRIESLARRLYARDYSPVNMARARRLRAMVNRLVGIT